MTGLLERAKELRGQTAVTSKNIEDAPNYHRVGNASLQRCGTCRHFTNSGRCDLYDFDADAMYTCDSWRPDIEAVKRARVETAAGVTLKHLPGQHNQDTHGQGGGGESGAMSKDEYINRWLTGEKPRVPKGLSPEKRREYERDAMRAVTAQDRARRSTTPGTLARQDKPGDKSLEPLRSEYRDIKALENGIALNTANHYVSKVGRGWQAEKHQKIFGTKQEAGNYVEKLPKIRRQSLLTKFENAMSGGKTLSGSDLDIYNQLRAYLGYATKEVSATPTAVYAHGPGGLFSPVGLGDTVATGRKRKKRKPARDGELVNAMITTKPGDKYRSIKNPKVYEALVAKGMSKSQAAAISNAMARRGKRKRKETAGIVLLGNGSGVHLENNVINPSPLEYAKHLRLKHLGGVHNQASHGFRFGATPSLEQARRYRKAGVLQDYTGRARQRTGTRPAAEREGSDNLAKAQNLYRRENDLQGKINALHNERSQNNPLKGYYKPSENKRRIAKQAEIDKKIAGLDKERTRLQKRAQELYALGNKPRLKPLPKSKAEVAQIAKSKHADMLTFENNKGDRVQLSVNRPRKGQIEVHIYQQGKSDRRTTFPLTQKSIVDILNQMEETNTGWGNIYNSIVEKEAKKIQPTTFTVFKDKTGRYRWVAISSTAYQDRDGEIVSTKALADDVAHADATKQYGTLRWWHVKGLDLGDCDFNMLYGKSLIESGTFKNDRIAERVKEKAHLLKLSLGFRHPADEPDKSGVFHTIRRFERSLIPPEGNASNMFTRLSVTG